MAKALYNCLSFNHKRNQAAMQGAGQPIRGNSAFSDLS